MSIYRSFLCGIIATVATTSVYSASLPPASGQQGMVATSHHLATQVGVDILKRGGNAIDAAVAVGYALAVVEPCCGNIGGGGFMLIRKADGRNIFLNFREKSPAAMRPKLFLDNKGHEIRERLMYGYLPVGVPGTVMGFNTALAKYGTMPLATIMAPAISLAKNGFTLSEYEANVLQWGANFFKRETNVASIFLKKGNLYQAGDRLTQPQLAATLTEIADKGSDAFYRGSIAKRLVKAMEQHGGVMTLKDLADYTVTEQQPITCRYRGHTIISAPPPSSGGIALCEALAITEAYPLKSLGYHAAASTHYTVEAMRYAYADRNTYLGDPDFIKNPTKQLLSSHHAANIRAKIVSFRAGDSSKIGPKVNARPEGQHTTHYSIVDKAGNAVAVTYTIDDYFGAKVIAGDTGFFLNNEMDDFALIPGKPNYYQLIEGSANAMQAGKRPLSSMAPTIVTKDNKLFMVLGAPGGSTIITTVLQTLQNVIDYGMNIQEAADAPRFHMQWLPDKIFTEPFTFSKDTQKILENMGYELQTGSPYNTPSWGAMAAILRDPATGKLSGAVDNRRPAGLARGF